MWCNDWLSWKQKRKNKINKYNKIRTDNKGSIIVLEVKTDDQIFLLIILYNPNTEEQGKIVLWTWTDVRYIFFAFLQKCYFFAGDFNCLFISNLEATGGNATLKKKYYKTISII